ncbi:ribonuclease HII [Candidatus Pantoea edessiphila]|uniref:Ribonuclease HII n=1 Tax=Candidatus Pantoea edessiphila TaxID=2044610 RepID=A0A2P5T295_9GAMM|nr:ribonuclease HII [Candidatus Pantoea edessiphila]PPI88683.1 ribonuclease HII [Candidatus Pantoea edessiphila]
MFDFNRYPDIKFIAGVDEVGRGALVGRIVTAAVILLPGSQIRGLSDSKKISVKKRTILYDEIIRQSLDLSIGYAEVEEIDRINVFHATMLAMRRAVDGLSITPNYVLVDGTHSPKMIYPTKTIIKGDCIISEISAASIIAKVTRDQEMINLDLLYPQYGFAQHKGYPTKVHINNLKKYGATPYHRRSFAPVLNTLI